MPLFGRRSEWPEALTLQVTETYFIAIGNRGAVLLGQLAGTGQLRPGDYVEHDGRSYRLKAIEAFRTQRKEAGPGDNIGLVLGTGVPPDGFEGAQLSFRRG